MTPPHATHSNRRIAAKMTLFLAIPLSVAHASAGFEALDKQLVERLDSIVSTYAREYDVPGLSVAIVKGPDVVYQNNHGVENVDKQTPVSSETIFRLGSISKVFTAMAIMQLSDRGLVDLDAPAHEYLPSLGLGNQDYKKITVRHLLTHTSGLPGDNKAHKGTPDFSDDAISRYVINMRDRPLEFTPGEKFSYSNAGYVVLSALIEEVTRTKFEDYVSTNILLPTGMKNSSFGRHTEGTDNLAALHVIGPDFTNTVQENDPYTRWTAGAGGLSSNIVDMCLFARALLNGGRIGSRQILGKKSLERMWERGEGTGDKGLAWSVYSVWGGRRLVDHGGNSLGYSAELALMPDESLAVVVLCNNRNGAEWPIAGALLRAMLGREPGEPAFYVDHVVQRKLREEGPDPALAYLDRVLAEGKEDVSCHDLLLLAYRIVQGGSEKNLEVSKAMVELLAEHFPDDPRVNSVLGEIYLRLAIKQYRESVRRDPADWAGRRMLEQLDGITIDFY